MHFSFVGIGEVLWDLLPGGRQMGGAPANVTCHAAALGARATLVSRVGQDADGEAIRARLAEFGVFTEAIEGDPTAPTGTVSVEVDARGQPRFTIHEGVAWDRLEGEAAARRCVAAADAVCFGTLAQRSPGAEAAIQQLLALAPGRAWRLLDVNLRQHYFSAELLEASLARANALKVNDAELPRIAALLGMAGEDRVCLEGFAARWSLRAIAFTRGEHGSLLWRDGRWSEHSGLPVRVVDTVGAGDAFTAAWVLGLLAGWDLDVVHERAATIAAHVVSCPGATPELPEHLRAPFLAIPHP